MKANKNIYYLIFIFFICSCAKDLGTYEYKELNNVKISGFVDAENGYILGILDDLQITPKISRTIENNENDLSFSWKINYKEVSTERNLNFTIPTTMPFGEIKCQYIVTNNSNGMKYFYDFTINVMSVFNFGYYVLSEEDDNTALISYLQSKYDANTQWKFTKSIGGVTLGKYPSQFGKKFKYLSSFKDYGFLFYVLCKEGKYNMIETNSFTFTPTTFANNSSYITNPDGVPFEPKSMIIGNAAIYFQTGNGVAVYAKGLMTPPASVEQTYDWALMGLYSMGQRIDKIWGYDKLSNKLYTLHYTPNDIINGIYGNIYSFDNIQEIENLPSLDGQNVIYVDLNTSYAPDYTSEISTLTVIATKAGSLLLHSLKTTQKLENWQPKGDPVITLSTNTIAIDGIDDKVTCKIFGTSYYFIIGNAIYSSPLLNPALTKVVDIPAGLGAPLKFDMGIDDSRLWVATYNPASTKNLKGSVVVIDPVNKNIESTFENVCGKPADISTADGSPWW
jgi:hypothetical protein